jgi:macrolide-specific efflux system membrane fusion protein
MTAEVHIVLAAARHVLTVPSTALGRRIGDKRYVVRVAAGDDAIAEREVDTGVNDKVTVEIRTGLAEGERVVTGEMSAEAASASRSRGFGPPPPMGM